MSKIKVVNFYCDDDLKQYLDSMLFDSGTVIASGDFEANGHMYYVSLEIRGEVRVIYKGDVYRYPSDFPDELIDRIRYDNNWWHDDKDLYIDMNNWFEYIIEDDVQYLDGSICEWDISNGTYNDILLEMKECVSWYAKEE